MTGDEWMTDELASALDEAVPNVDQTRQLLVDAYNAATGEHLNASMLAPEAAGRVAAWLRDGGVLLIRRQTHLSSALYGDLASKLVYLGQTHCSVCGRYETDDPIVVLPIRISPKSVQVLRAKPGTVAAYKQALSNALADRGHNYGSRPVCVQLTFLLKAGRQGDLDNLAKATIDAMQGRLFDDDAQIVHLSLQRLTANGDDEAVVVRIQPSRLDEHHEVFDKTLRIGWAGAGVVNLDDFMP